jgi:hypothetical protein
VRNEYTPFCNGRGRGPWCPVWFPLGERAAFFERESGMGRLARFDENAAIRFQNQSVTLSISKWEENPMNSHVAKLATASSFGIALLGLYFIFTSTNTHLSLSACAMYIVGTVVGVLLLQSDK